MRAEEVIVDQSGRARRKQTGSARRRPRRPRRVPASLRRRVGRCPGTTAPGRKLDGSVLGGLGGPRGRLRSRGCFALGRRAAGGRPAPDRAGRRPRQRRRSASASSLCKGERRQVSTAESFFVSASRGQKSQRAEAVATGRRAGLSRDGDALGIPDRSPPRPVPARSTSTPTRRLRSRRSPRPSRGPTRELKICCGGMRRRYSRSRLCLSAVESPSRLSMNRRRSS